MGSIFFSLVVLPALVYANPAQKLAHLFLDPHSPHRRPISWTEELHEVDPQRALALLRGLRGIDEVADANRAGRRLRDEIFGDFARHLSEDRRAVARLNAAFAELSRRTRSHGATKRLIAAEIAAASSLGVSDLGIFGRSENWDLRKIWRKRTEVELLRSDALGNKEIPPSLLRAWRGEQTEAFLRLADHAAGEIVGLIKNTLQVEFRHPDEDDVWYQSIDIPGARVLTGFDSEGPRIYLETPAGNVGVIVDGETTEPFELNSHPRVLLNTFSLEDQKGVLDLEKRLSHLRDLMSVIFWLGSLDERETLASMETSLGGFTHAIALSRPNARQLEAEFEWEESATDYHTPALAQLILNLSFSRLATNPGYWLPHLENRTLRPLFFVARLDPTSHAEALFTDESTPRLNINSARDSRSHAGATSAASPTPPPIQQYPLRQFYRVTGAEDERLPTIFRSQIPADANDTWDPTAVAGGPSALYLESRRSARSRDRFVAVPTPIGRTLTKITVRSRAGELRPGLDFEVHRSRSSRAYAIKLTVPRLSQVRIAAAFGARERIPEISIPPPNEADWREVAAELARSGEVAISTEMRRRSPLDPADLARLIASHHFYTYHPESERPITAGLFGDLTPFLDDRGALCIQCKHAAQFLLERMLKLFYGDRSDLEFRSTRFLLLRPDSHLDLNGHQGLEVFRAGRLVAHLNPSSATKDSRAPTANFLEIQELGRRLDQQRDQLATTLGEVIARAGATWPRGLPQEAPFNEIWRLARRIKRGEPVASERLEVALDRLSVWANAPSLGDRTSSGVSLFHRAMINDLQRLSRDAAAVIDTLDCARRLER